MAYTGHKSTVTFQTSGWEANVISVAGPDGYTVEDIDVSHLGTSGTRRYIPGDLIEGGTVTLTVEYAPGSSPPVGGPQPNTVETVALWISRASVNVTFDGYINSFSVGNIVTNEKIEATVGIKVAGPITNL